MGVAVGGTGVGVSFATVVVAEGDIAEGTCVEVAAATAAVGVIATDTGVVVGSGSPEHARTPTSAKTSAATKSGALKRTPGRALKLAPLGGLEKGIGQFGEVDYGHIGLVLRMGVLIRQIVTVHVSASEPAGPGAHHIERVR